MFTSRAEHRLLLREDNADLRLTPKGRELGLVDDERWDLFQRKQVLSDLEVERLNRTRVRPAEVSSEWQQRVLKAPLGRDNSGFELLRRPEVDYASLLEVIEPPEWLASTSAIDDRLPSQIRAQVEVRAKYAGYIERQQDEIDRQQRNEETSLPANLDYAAIAGLSTEVRQKLAEAQPATVGQASRIPGVTPAAVSILIVHLKKRSLAGRSRVA
jgi:tRNA uridine 5-carboxymethylaminomethyl modification enzyme